MLTVREIMRRAESLWHPIQNVWERHNHVLGNSKLQAPLHYGRPRPSRRRRADVIDSTMNRVTMRIRWVKAPAWRRCSPDSRERLTTGAGGEERQWKQGELKEIWTLVATQQPLHNNKVSVIARCSDLERQVWRHPQYARNFCDTNCRRYGQRHWRDIFSCVNGFKRLNMDIWIRAYLFTRPVVDC